MDVSESEGNPQRVRELHDGLIEFLDRPRPGVRDPEAHRWATSLYRQLVELHETASRTKRTVDEQETRTRLALAHPRASRKLERVRRDRDRKLCDLRAIVNDAQQRDARGDRRIVRLPPRPVATSTARNDRTP